jgi:hypothetical protein
VPGGGSRVSFIPLGPNPRMAVRINYALIDYKNVRPSDLAMLRGGPFKVKVFLGTNQAKIPVPLAAALQGLGTNAVYVLLESSGSNAPEFHIAHYIGILSAQDPLGILSGHFQRYWLRPLDQAP